MLVIVEEALSTIKKVIVELSTWFILSAISYGISASIIKYFIERALAQLHTYEIPINILMISFGAIWLMISTTLLHNIWNIMRKHACLPFIKMKIRELKVDEVTCAEGIALVSLVSLLTCLLGTRIIEECKSPIELEVSGSL